MSDFQGSQNSVLLPTSRIALFVKDEGMKQVATSLQDDWRFARVTIEINDGDVENAISLYSGQVSPDLVMVETTEMSDAFVSRLEVLGGNCAEKTAAVVVGPVNDVYLYRKLIDMGVSDYLVKPISSDVMAQVFSKILIERLGAQNSRLIACIGTKGGVGASSISQTIAAVASENLGQKTIILDAAGGWSYLSVAMGGESVTTLHEVARAAVSSDKDSFNRMIVSVSEKLSFLGTGAESLMDDTVSAENFETIINRLMQTFPVVVMDLSAASIEVRRAVLARANDVVVVTTPTLPALRCARGLLQETRTIRGGTDSGLHIVLNKKGIGTGHEVSEGDMAHALKVKPELNIAFQPKLFGAAEAQGKPVSQISGSADVVKSIQTFLEEKLNLSGEKSTATSGSLDKSGLLDGLLGKIKKK